MTGVQRSSGVKSTADVIERDSARRMEDVLARHMDALNAQMDAHIRRLDAELHRIQSAVAAFVPQQPVRYTVTMDQILEVFKRTAFSAGQGAAIDLPLITRHMTDVLGGRS